MELNLKNISSILALIIAIATVAGFIYQADARYAKQEYVKSIEERLEQKIDRDRMEALQEEIWRMEERWEKKFIADKGRDPETIEEVVQYMYIKSEDDKKKYQKLKKELKELEDKHKKKEE